MTASFATTDTELRGLVLQAFYTRRQHRGFHVPATEWVDGRASFDDLCRVCSHLGEHGLIEWHPTQEGGAARITALGVDVVEGQRLPEIAIQHVHNYTNNISGSANVIIGNNNSQAVTSAFEELLHAVDAYGGSEAEKEKSKSLLSQLAKSPAFAQVVGHLTRFGLEHLPK